MANPKATYETVSEAIESLKAEGEKEPISLDKIRERIGGGSKVTIALYRDRYSKSGAESIIISGKKIDLKSFQDFESFRSKFQEEEAEKTAEAVTTLELTIETLEREAVEDRRTIEELKEENKRLIEERDEAVKSEETARLKLVGEEKAREALTASFAINTESLTKKMEKLEADMLAQLTEKMTNFCGSVTEELSEMRKDLAKAADVNKSLQKQSPQKAESASKEKGASNSPKTS